MRKLIILFSLISFSVLSQEISNVAVGGGTRYKTLINVNPETYMIATRMQSIPSGEVLTVMDEIIDSMKATGIWDSCYAFYNFAVQDSLSAKINWKSGSYTITNNKCTFIPYVGFFTDRRLGYLNTNLIFSSISGADKNSTSASVYYQDRVLNFQATTATVNGVRGTGSYITFHAPAVNKQYKFGSTIINNSTSSALYDITDLQGLYTVSRKNTSAYSYHNNVTGTATNASVSLPDRTFYLLAYNNAGTAQNFVLSIMGMSFIGKHLTASQYQSLKRICDKWHTQITMNDNTVLENDYIQYQLCRNKTNKKFNFTVFAQLGNTKIGAMNDSIFMSLDCGLTYPYRQLFIPDDSIDVCIIYPNNAITIGTRRKLYYSGDSLSTIVEKTLMKGSVPYVLHTPVNAAYPGNYYLSLTQPIPFNSGKKIVVWGNYVNTGIIGNAPPLIYFSSDSGKTIKVAYEFGQNPNFRDNGTAGGLATTGNLLGNASNPIYTKHIHGVSYDAVHDSLYAYTGDNYPEIMWLRGKYDAELDTIIFEQIYGSALGQTLTDRSKFKSVGLNFIGDTLIYGADANLNPGVYKTSISNILDSTNHVKIKATTASTLTCFVYGNKIVATSSNQPKIIHVSNNFGITWHDVTIPEFTTATVNVFRSFADSNGYFLISNNNEIAQSTAYQFMWQIKVK